MNDEMKALSPTALRALAKILVERASALEAEQPSAALAIAAGVRDTSYGTVRYGTITSYSGEGIVKMADGRRWKCVGHGPSGNAEVVTRRGYIEYIPLEG